MLPFFLCVFSPHVGLALELFYFFDFERWRKESEEMMDSAYVKLFLHQSWGNTVRVVNKTGYVFSQVLEQQLSRHFQKILD